MKRRMFLILLCITAVCMVGIATATLRNAGKAKAKPLATTSAPQQTHPKKPDPPGTIDGEKNPELIPKRTAYLLLFRLLANRQTEAEKDSVRAYLKQRAGLDEANSDALIAAANEFSQQVSILDSQAKEIKDRNWPNPNASAMAQLHHLQHQKELIVDRIISSLSYRLNGKSLESLRVHTEQIKRRMKIFPDPQSSPGGADWQPHVSHQQ